MLLGRKTLRDIALTFSVVESFTQDLSDDIYADFWKRSLTTSCVASHLSQGVREVDSQDAYTVGLLTDLGILVLAQLESDRYLPLYRNNAHGPALIAAERNEFGFDHAQLAAGLLQAWNFPAVFAIAIASHHDEEMSAFTPLSRIVRAGNLMPAAIWIRDGDAYMEAYSWFQFHFDFDVDQFVGLAFEVNRAVAEAAKIYAVKNLAPVDPDALEEKSRTLMEAVGCGGVAG
jgi:hypothetical protein